MVTMHQVWPCTYIILMHINYAMYVHSLMTPQGVVGEFVPVKKSIMQSFLKSMTLSQNLLSPT